MISLLIPSRGRPGLLSKNIKSWRHEDVEILVALDENDPMLDKYFKISGITQYVMQQYGYEKLHEYYNFLLKASSGDWIMLGNDDAVMQTTDWVEKIQQQDHTKPMVLNVWSEVDNLFPVISRELADILGHFSLNTHTDSWVQQVGERSGINKYIPDIKIIHDKPNDETGQASTHIAYSQTGPSFSSEATQTLINQDAQKVLNHIGGDNNAIN